MHGSCTQPGCVTSLEVDFLLEEAPNGYRLLPTDYSWTATLSVFRSTA
jgi:hypothetical protein